MKQNKQPKQQKQDKQNNRIIIDMTNKIIDVRSSNESLDTLCDLSLFLRDKFFVDVQTNNNTKKKDYVD